MDGYTMIDKRTGEVLGPEIDSKYQKDKLQAYFIVYIDYKITYCKAGVIHILNDIDTLGT